LRRLARKTKNANQSRRMLVLAEIYDGSMSSLRRGLATMLKTPHLLVSCDREIDQLS